MISMIAIAMMVSFVTSAVHAEETYPKCPEKVKAVANAFGARAGDDNYDRSLETYGNLQGVGVLNIQDITWWVMHTCKDNGAGGRRPRS